MKSISTTKRRYTLPLLLLLLIALITVYIGEIVLTRGKQAEIMTLRQELALEHERDRHAKGMETFLSDIRTHQKEMDTYFTTPGAAILTIENLEELGRIADVSFEIIQVNTAQTSTGKDVLVADINASGPWQNIMHVLTLLETMPLQSTIPYATLSGGLQGTSSVAAWNMSVTIQIGLKNI